MNLGPLRAALLERGRRGRERRLARGRGRVRPEARGRAVRRRARSSSRGGSKGGRAARQEGAAAAGRRAAAPARPARGARQRSSRSSAAAPAPGPSLRADGSRVPGAARPPDRGGARAARRGRGDRGRPGRAAAASRPLAAGGRSTTRCRRSPTVRSRTWTGRSRSCGDERAAVRRVNGPVVEVEGLESAMLDLVQVGRREAARRGDRLDGPVATVQVYAYTGGLRPGDPVVSTGHPLRAELGPGLLGGVFDGMLRPLAGAGELRPRPSLGRRRSTAVAAGSSTRPAPRATASGRATSSARCRRPRRSRSARSSRPACPAASTGSPPAGPYTVDDPVARVAGNEIRLVSTGRSGRPRPCGGAPAGGCAARHRAARPRPPLPDRPRDERGGAGRLRHREDGPAPADREVVRRRRDRLRRLRRARERGGGRPRGAVSQLEDPRTGRSLLDRTVLIANTSNMPVLAREASIYTGVDRRRVLPRHGLRRRPDRRLDLALGRGAARGRLAHRRAAGGGGLSRPGLASALAAFYERAGPRAHARGRRRVPDDPRRRLAAGRRHDRARHRAHAALRPLRLVARPGPRLRAPLPRDQLGRLLVARRRGDRRSARWSRATLPGGRGGSGRSGSSPRPSTSSRWPRSSAPARSRTASVW